MIADLDIPEPQPEWKVESVRWDEPQMQQALDLSADSAPHRAPLAAFHAMGSHDVGVCVLTHRGKVTAACCWRTSGAPRSRASAA